MLFFNIDIAFAADGKKIRLPIAEVLLCAATGNLAQSKKQQDWTSCNAVLLPQFFTEAAILHGKSDAGELLNIFACSIIESASDADSSSEVDEANNDNSIVTIEAAENKNPGKAKQASAETSAAETVATIADDCDDVLAFLQAVVVKSLRVIAVTLSLCADKRARVVPTIDRHKPTKSHHGVPTIPPGSHRHPY